MVGMDNARCVHLHDDGRTGHAVAGAQPGAIVNLDRSETAVEISGVLIDHSSGCIGPFFLEPRKIDLLHGPDADRAEIHELHSLIELEALDALVRHPETAGKVA
jgi:hypothetical protein